MSLARWTSELRDDVRFGLRQLRRAPAFTLVAVTTLALGIGANSAIFALVDKTLLRPLPYRDPERLVMLFETNARSARNRVAALNMLDWDERNRTFEKIAGYVNNVGGMVMTGKDGSADTVPRQWVSSGIFEVLGVRPIAGRTFLPEDDQQQANVVVLSEAFWRTRFAADPAVVGRDLRLDGESYTVVGVVPADFQLLGETSMWALRSYERTPQMRGTNGLVTIGRLRQGVSLEAARSDLSAISAQLAREFPTTNAGRGVAIEPLHDALVGSELRLTSMLFLGVVGFVLLICCANVANLLLARASVRAARARDPVGGRRRPAPRRTAARDREPAALRPRRRARRGHRRGDPGRGSLARPAGAAARGGDARRSTRAWSGSARRPRSSSGCCSAWLPRGRRRGSRLRR